MPHIDPAKNTHMKVFPPLQSCQSGNFSILVVLDIFSIACFFQKWRFDCHLCGGGHLLNLDLGHGSAGTAEVGGLGLGVLGVVVADGRLDGVFGKHGAVDWDEC